MNKRIFRILLAITLVSLAGQAILLPYLPEFVPIHWNINGKIDSWGNKHYLLIFGLLPFAILISLWITPKIDPRKQNYYNHQKTYSILTIALTLIFTAFNWVITISSLGMEIPVSNIIQLLVGLTFLIIGNYMPRLRSNYFFGFKTPWAIENDIVWRKTNRAAGILFYISGIIMMLFAFIPPGILSLTPLILLLLGIIVVSIYSLAVYKKIQSKKEENNAEDK